MNKKYKHLNIEDREYIEELLNNDIKLNTIADVIKKHPTSISKEIKDRRILNETNAFNQKYKDYKMEFNKCQRLKRFPHICNGCPKKIGCRKEKFYYRSRLAQRSYEEELSFSRTGLDISNEEFVFVN